MAPRRRLDLNVRVIDGATVVLDRRENRVHQLNESATFIWDLCNGEHAPAEIAQQLSLAYGLDATTAQRDVARVLRQLRRLGLLDGGQAFAGIARREQ